jgi:hypothetical protein
MNCREFEIEWAALDDSSGLTSLLDSHRQECKHCSDLVDDLNAIRKQARQLKIDLEPPQRVWATIQNQLEMEGLAHRLTAAAPAGKVRRSRARGWLSAVPMGLAYISVFLLTLAGMYVRSKFADPVAVQNIAPAPAPPEVAQIRQATAERDRKVQELALRVSEEHRATLVSSWNQLNASINNQSDFVMAHPWDDFALQGLRHTFQQSENFMEPFVRLEELPATPELESR